MHVTVFTVERRLAPAASSETASSSRRIPVSCIIVKESRAERPRGSQRGYPCRKRLSWLLQSGVGFLRDPLPGLPWASLAVGFPLEAEKVGLTTFRDNHRIV